MDPIKKDIRCAVCKSEFVSAVLNATKEQSCPICRTTVPPLKINQDGFIKINWQSIRVLAIYAQRWAETFDTSNPANREYIRALKNIINELEIYRPKTGKDLNPAQELPANKEGQIDKPMRSPYFQTK
jgi:hypothetical protein